MNGIDIGRMCDLNVPAFLTYTDGMSVDLLRRTLCVFEYADAASPSLPCGGLTVEIIPETIVEVLRGMLCENLDELEDLFSALLLKRVIVECDATRFQMNPYIVTKGASPVITLLRERWDNYMRTGKYVSPTQSDLLSVMERGHESGDDFPFGEASGSNAKTRRRDRRKRRRGETWARPNMLVNDNVDVTNAFAGLVSDDEDEYGKHVLSEIGCVCVKGRIEAAVLHMPDDYSLI